MKNKKRIIKLIIVTILLWVISFGYNSQVLNYNGIDYSKEYNIYKSVCDKTDLEDITTELEKQKIDYTIENAVISLDDYSHISFEVDYNNGYKICSNEIMENFKVLDTKDVKKVIEKGQYDESKGSYVKKYKYNDCSLISGKYYYLPIVLGIVLIVIMIALLLLAIIFNVKLVDCIFDAICKRKTKQEEKTKTISYDNDD